MVDFKLSNVVASCYVADGINPDEIIAYWPEASYNPMSPFRAISYTQGNPKSAQLVFEDGKVITTGARSIASARISVQNVGVELERLGIPIYDPLFVTIENLVGRVSLDKKLDLHHLARELENTEFDPAAFPGIIIKETRDEEGSPGKEAEDAEDRKYEVSTLIFSSGKIVITGHKGAKAEEDLKESFDKIVDLVEEKMKSAPEDE